ncbi:hypothetical protein AB0L26_09115 [Streptomyces nondiastaticus]|uniref:hypothetical protein n=1 Tax=Streptomyces nondiastaticus TaxID=3154512 RepID=UPI003431D9FC
MLRATGLPGEAVPGPAADRIRRCWVRLHGGRTLVVLDNALRTAGTLRRTYRIRRGEPYVRLAATQQPPQALVSGGELVARVAGALSFEAPQRREVGAVAGRRDMPGAARLAESPPVHFIVYDLTSLFARGAGPGRS